MEAFEQWMEHNKKLCIVTGIFGLLVSPFLWPFFLAILFHSLSLSVPVLLAWMLYEQSRKKSEENNEKRMDDTIDEKGFDASKDGTDPVSAGHAPEGRTSKEPDTVAKQQLSREDALAILWYQLEGRERILRIKKKLCQEGRSEFSVSKDGICSIRQEQRFERIGILRGYPGARILAAEKELQKDGFKVKAVGDYLWISWAKGGVRHAV